MVTNYKKKIHIQQTQGSKFGILYMHHKMKMGSVFVYVKVSFLVLVLYMQLQNPKELSYYHFRLNKKVKDPPNCHEPSTTFSSVWFTKLSSTSFLLLLSFDSLPIQKQPLYGTPIPTVPPWFSRRNIYIIKNLCGILLCVAAWFTTYSFPTRQN